MEKGGLDEKEKEDEGNNEQNEENQIEEKLNQHLNDLQDENGEIVEERREMSVIYEGIIY